MNPGGGGDWPDYGVVGIGRSQAPSDLSGVEGRIRLVEDSRDELMGFADFAATPDHFNVAAKFANDGGAEG